MTCREILIAAALAWASAAGPRAESIQNAADIYRQAFAAMPKLEEGEKAKFDAAIVTTPPPLTGDLQEIVARFDAALRELHRAREAATCDWNLDEAAGFRLRLPHLSQAVELSQAALFRARLRFAAEAADDGVADIVAVLKMARDCASSGLLIQLTVDRALEKSAIEILAANLPCLSVIQLDGLAATLRRLPATPSVAECLRHEADIMVQWIEGFIDGKGANLAGSDDGGRILDALYEVGLVGGPPAPRFQAFTVADLRESLRLLRADYAALVEILELPPGERRARLAEWKANRSKARPTGGEDRARRLSWDLIPSVDSFAEQDDRLRTRRELLRLAIDVQRRGPDAAKGVAIPGQGPIEYRATATGFELVCGAVSIAQAAPQAAPSAANEAATQAATKSPPRRPLLEVGSPAPPLAAGEWLQGEPVANLSKGEAFLVEFWATWCGPCLTSIPHVNDIARTWKDKGLVVIGQNVHDGDAGAVQQLIDKMGDTMTYRVALDDKTVIKNGAMAETWLTAADCGGIPWAFLVDKDGMIAWIGHPMELDEAAIEQVLAGTFDLSKAAADSKAAKAAAQAARVAAQAARAAAAEPEVLLLRVGGAP